MPPNKTCRCRNCGIMYDPNKSRAEYKGYCSAGCVHEKAKRLGHRKPTKRERWAGIQPPSEYKILKAANAIGNINEFGDALEG